MSDVPTSQKPHQLLECFGQVAHAKTQRHKGGTVKAFFFRSWRLCVLSEAGVRTSSATASGRGRRVDRREQTASAVGSEFSRTTNPSAATERKVPSGKAAKPPSREGAHHGTAPTRNGAATSSSPFQSVAPGDEDIAAPNPCPTGAVLRCHRHKGDATDCIGFLLSVW